LTGILYNLAEILYDMEEILKYYSANLDGILYDMNGILHDLDGILQTQHKLFKNVNSINLLATSFYHQVYPILQINHIEHFVNGNF